MNAPQSTVSCAGCIQYIILMPLVDSHDVESQVASSIFLLAKALFPFVEKTFY